MNFDDILKGNEGIANAMRLPPSTQLTEGYSVISTSEQNVSKEAVKEYEQSLAVNPRGNGRGGRGE